MCVIFLSYKQHPKYPLTLLANRDEFYDRPTAKADYWKDYPDVLAGRDLVANGTWLGVTKKGRFSAVTNYRDPGQEKGEISRGRLVAEFLTTNLEPKSYLENVKSKAQKYGGFNLLVGELSSARSELLYFSNRQNEIKTFSPGLYGLSNQLLDTPWRKVVKGKAAVKELLDGQELRKEELFEVLADKTLASDEELLDTGIGYEKEKLLSSIFIETPIYGTRCSTIVTFNEKFEIDFEERVFV